MLPKKSVDFEAISVIEDDSDTIVTGTITDLETETDTDSASTSDATPMPTPKSKSGQESVGGALTKHSEMKSSSGADASELEIAQSSSNNSEQMELEDESKLSMLPRKSSQRPQNHRYLIQRWLNQQRAANRPALVKQDTVQGQDLSYSGNPDPEIMSDQPMTETELFELKIWQDDILKEPIADGIEIKADVLSQLNDKETVDEEITTVLPQIQQVDEDMEQANDDLKVLEDQMSQKESLTTIDDVIDTIRIEVDIIISITVVVAIAFTFTITMTCLFVFQRLLFQKIMRFLFYCCLQAYQFRSTQIDPDEAFDNESGIEAIE